MPRPRHHVAFTTSRRALCLEMGTTVARISLPNDIRKIIKVAEDAGWSVVVTRNHRLKWLDANGRQVTVSSAHGQTGDVRALANLKAALRRGGLTLPEDEERAKGSAKQVVIEEVHEVELDVEDITPEQAVEVLMEYVTTTENQVNAATFSAMEAELAEKTRECKAVYGLLDQARENCRTLQTQVAAQAATLEQITSAFEKPSWEVLPTIARICGLQVGS